MQNQSDFEFYLKFTKPLILNLPQINDRVLAAAWVKRLAIDTSIEEKIKLDYLKLLLFVLQRRKLAPPFTDHPNNVETLDGFPEKQTLVDVAKKIIEKDHKDRMMKRLKAEESGDYPFYVSDFSADLLEYVAIQNIENFGVHAYYAVSKEPLNSWYRVDKQLFPKAAKSMLEVGSPPSTLVESLSSPELEKPAEKSVQEEPPVEQPPSEEPPAEVAESPQPPEPEKEESPPKKSPRRSALGAKPPSRPIGKIPPPSEDREPPSWGSNLLEAKLLDEEVAGIVQEKEVEETTAAAPMEVLWTPEGPFMVDEDIDTHWSSAASLPYATPPYAKPPPPPRKIVKKPAIVKPTRASLLLQKKKQAELAPPPPPPKKPPLKRKPKIVKPMEAAPPEEPKEEKGKTVAKKISKGKVVRGKKKSEPEFGSPGSPFKGYGDDVGDYVTQYQKLLGEMEEQYQEDLQRQLDAQKAVDERAEAARRHEKRSLSHLAKRSGQTIPKEHDVPVELDKSIHVSPEAQQLLEEIVEGPSTSTGITHPPHSINYPQPRLQHDIIEEGEEETGVDEETAETQITKDIEYAEMETAGGGSKDPRIVSMYNQLVDASQPAVEEDSFEAMERLIEEEMRKEGKEPEERKKKRLTKKEYQASLKRFRDLHEKLEQQEEALDDAHVQGIEGDIDQWVGADEYFTEVDRRYYKTLPDEQKYQAVIPRMKVPTEEEGLEDELLPDDVIDDIDDIFSPDQTEVQAQRLDIYKIYKDYFRTLPSYSFVPVTSPSSPVSPKRPGDSDLLTAEKRREIIRRHIFPPSPPTPEEAKIKTPTTPGEYERFVFSPDRVPPPEYVPTKEVDASIISPKSKTWAFDLDDLHHRLHGTPPQTEPTVFDLPIDKLVTESPPPVLVSDVSPLLTPPIDKEELRKDIQSRRKFPYDPSWNTDELRKGSTQIMELRRHPQDYVKKPLWKLPISEVYESPEREYQFDVPDDRKYFEQSPPGGLLDDTPETVEEEEIEFETPKTPEFLEDAKLDWEMQEQLEKIKAASFNWRKEFLPVKQSPELDVIGSPVYYPSSPFAREVAPGTPEREGPRRKELRRRLKKRRLDFSKELESPDENVVEVTDVETTVYDRDLITPPDQKKIQEEERRKFETEQRKALKLSVSPLPQRAVEGSPRTPPKYWEEEMPHVEDLPEFSPFDPSAVFVEHMPEVDDLPEFSPASPMSEWDTMEGIKAGVRSYVHKGPRRPGDYKKFIKGKRKKLPYPWRFPEKVGDRQLKEFYKKYPWKLPERIPEDEQKERIALLHDELETSAEREYEELRRAHLTLMDEPIPEDLPEPMQPPLQVPFYKTPPEYKYIPLSRPIDMRRHHEGKFFYTPEEMKIPDPDREMDELEEFKNLEHYTLLETEAAPSSFVDPNATIMEAKAEKLQQLAADQYAALGEITPKTPKRRGPTSVQDIMAQVQAMSPSPGYHKAVEAARAAEEAARAAEAARQAAIEFEIQQKIKAKKEAKAAEKKARLDRLVKGVGVKKTVRETQPPPEKKVAKGRGVKPVKSDKSIKDKKSDKSIKAKKSDKSIKSTKSDKSIKGKKSDKSIKGTKSEASIKESKSGASVKGKKSGTTIAKPKRKHFDVVSKIDTGVRRGMKPKKPPEQKPPEQPPPMQVQYDLAALQDLGLTAADLQNLNLNDVGVVHLEAEPAARLPDGRLPAVTETEEEYNETDTGLPPKHRIGRSGRRPVSEVEAEEVYDPRIQQMTTNIHLRGVTIPERKKMEFSPVFDYPQSDQIFAERRAAQDFRQLEQGGEEEEWGDAVQMMTVEAEGGFAEVAPWVESPSILQAVSPTEPLMEEEQNAIIQVQAAGRRSPGPYDYTWGGTSPIPPHMAGLKWLQSTERGDVLPWDEED